MPLTNTPPPEGASLVLCAPGHDGRWYAIYEHGANETHLVLPKGVKPPKTWTAEVQAECTRPAADDPPGTIRDTGNATILDESQPEAHVNRYFIKWAPAYDTDETHPWVGLNHEAGLQRMPNDLMDRYPIVPADVVQQLLAITRT